MSGIAGVFGESDENIVKEMLEKIKHRGRQCRIVHGKNFVLGFIGDESQIYEGARIACIDGFAGIGVEKGVKAAREALRRGRMAEVYGNFAGVEAGEKKLHLFRDHFGVKPMYFAKKGNVVYFGSELKTFTSLAVKNVKLVKPGEIVTVESGKIRRQRYYLLKYREQGMEIEFALKKLKKLIEEAVQFAMPENGRTAALLSGGLDSSCIVWFAAKKNATGDICCRV